MASDSTASPLPDPNRHITDNDQDGKSFFNTTLPLSLPVIKDLGGALQRLAYSIPPAPSTLSDQADIKTYQGDQENPPMIVPVNGTSAVWYIDVPPDSASPMHRTVSVDVVIQLKGELEHTLESGETRTVKPGDVTIQRSTSHMWRNASKTEWARMIAVISQAQPVQVGDKTLGEEFQS